jgi:hypothetical protein
MSPMALDSQPLPYAPDADQWSWVERSDFGIHGASDVVYRVQGEGPELPEELHSALDLLLHRFDVLEDRLQNLLEQEHSEEGPAFSARTSGPALWLTLGRILPRLLTFRWKESTGTWEFVYESGRPSALHVLERVLDSDFKFRLEDLSHFAAHGALVLSVLEAVGLENALSPAGILYCPAVDSPFPFKFFPVAGQAESNRDTYLRLLRKLLSHTETDEVFRARHFRELTRGFQKFGPAAATPEFQEVELRLWRLLSYVAARLRVKAGRLTDTKDPAEERTFLVELRQVHEAVNELTHLPAVLAAYYRTHFNVEFSKIYERALEELDGIAIKADCDLTDQQRTIDTVAALVSEFRRLGSVSPLQSLLEKDHEILMAYGVEPPPLETGWSRAYTKEIFTGAARFDTRRFGPVEGSEGELDESELDLDLDLEFNLGADEEVVEVEEEVYEDEEGGWSGDEEWSGDAIDDAWGSEQGADDAAQDQGNPGDEPWEEAGDAIDEAWGE